MKNFTRILVALLLAITVCNTASAVNETKTVGTTPGANYATLKAAFDAINAGTLSGAITLQIIDNTTETVQPEMKASGTGAASYTSVTIYPTVSGKTIYGNFPGANVYLNGADNVTIDGRVNRTGTTADLTITNDTRYAIAFYGGATNNTIRYCTLKGSMYGDTYGGVVHFNGQYGGAGNNANIIEYNNITSTINGLTNNAIYSQGYATGPVLNSDNIIRYNNIYDVWKGAIGASSFIKLGTNNSGWTILGNSMYNTTELNVPSTSGAFGIFVSSDYSSTNMTIHNNYIGGSAPQCGGTPLTQNATQNSPFNGISVYSPGNNSIQGNTIKNISWQSSVKASMILISMAAGNFDCGTTEANILGGASGTGSISLTGGVSASNLFYGIYMSNILSSQTVDCRNNIIGSITTANTDPQYGVGTYGINVWNTVAGNVTVSNNFIGSTDTPNSIFASSSATNATQVFCGIMCRGTGNSTISENTISNLTNAQETNGYTIGIYSDNGTNTITNNSIHHLSSSATSTNAPGNYTYASVTGIAISGTATLPNTITGNTIYNLTNTSASFAGYVVGLSYYWGATQSTISQNYIYDLFVTGATSTNANIDGMYISTGVVNLINNIVILGGDTKTNAYGFYLNNAAAADYIRMFFNTSYLGGSLASGSANKSSGLYSAGTSGTRDFRNNLLINARSTAGATSKHYAIYYGTTGGTFTANYNDYSVSGTGGMLGYYGGDKSTLALLRTATTQDANSLNANPLFANAGGSATSDYIPGTTLTGEQLEVPADYAGTTREFFTMGAYEAVLLPIIPSAPTVNNPHITSLDVAVNANGNPVANQFAIQDSVNNLYLQADGTRADTAVWQTAAVWGTKTVTGLTSGTTYSFRVKARNSNLVESDFGPTASGIPGEKPTVAWQPGQWAETQPTGNANKMWISVALSSNGVKQLAASFNSRLYKSTDGGTSWSETQPAGDADKKWISVAISTDGTTMMAAVEDGRVYTSTDNGAIWSETMPTGTAENKKWCSVALSEDGFIMLAAVYNGRVYKSTNIGFSWIETTPTGTAENKQWSRVAMSSTGMVMVASAKNNRIYRTTDMGATWSQINPAPTMDRFWVDIAMTTDGNTILAAVGIEGRLYKTTNGGTSWSEPMPAGNTDIDWKSVALSSDGLTMLAGVSNGRLYKSVDGGTTWSETQPAGDNNKVWAAVAVSSDATSILAGEGYGRLYCFTPVIVANITTNSATANGNITATNGPDATNRGAIIYPYTDTDKVIGDANVTNISNPGTFGTGTYAVSFTSLTPGTHYNARAHATNTFGTGYSDRTGFWTLPVVTLAPTVDNPTATTLDVTINDTINSAGTEYAILDSVSTNYVQANGTLADTIVWQTAASWGSVTVTGLTTGTTYYFRVKACNGEQVETAFSPSASGIPVDHPYVAWQPASVWGETQPAGDANKDWYALSISNNGNVQLAVVSPGRIYRSANGGTAWGEVQPAGDVNQSWSSVAVSNDGTTMLASVQGGRLYKSTDGGITWSETKPNGNNNEIWSSVSLSASGDTMLVSVANGRVYKSDNKGINWSQTYPAGNVSKYWQLVAISANGQGLLAGITGGRLYKSNNGGTNWAETQPAGNADKSWRAISVSADGLTMIAGVFMGRLYKSNDGGNNWSETQPDGNSNKNWRSVSVSADGLTMLAAVYQGRIYKSVDGGTSWSETQPAGNNFQKWSSVALSSDAGRMLAGVGEGRLYRTYVAIFTSITSTSALANGNITGTNGANATSRGAIIYPYTDTDKIIGDADVTNISNPGTFGTGIYPVSFTDLAPGTHYNARAHATNTYGTGYSDRTAFWTLAVVPLAPTVDNPTATTLDVTVNDTINSDGTEYAIMDSVSTNYVQANGTLADTIVWQTAASWVSVTVTGLTTGTTYYFKVKARNGEQVETAFSPTTSGIPVDHPYVAWQPSISWSETQPAGAATKWWNTVSISSNGLTMLAGVLYGRLYISTDGGTNWSETQPAGAYNKNWRSVSVSGDGQIMLACVFDGRLYKSTDGGTSWSETQPAGALDQNWTSISISSDGQTMLAGVYAGRLYKSLDGGTSWSETQPAGNTTKNWMSTSISSDGQTMLAGVYSGGRLYISADGGINWSETQPAGNTDKNWISTTISSDGATLLAGVSGGRLYKSINSGTNWSETQPAGNTDQGWNSVSISANGSAILAGVNNGRLYKSADGGTNWSDTQPVGNTDKFWQSVAVSADGSTLLAGTNEGLYKSRAIFEPITSTTASATVNITATNGADASNRGAIWYEYTDTDKIIGDAGVTSVDSTGVFGTVTYPVSFTGLTPNTRYNARAHATNTYGTGYSVRTDFWTLANVPLAPTVDNPTATSLDVAVNENDNPATTEYAILDSANNLYVQPNGTLSVSASWQTAALWGTITVSNLSTGVTYTFCVKARNGENTETAFSPGTAKNTCSNPTQGGSVSENQTICYQTQPNELINVSDASDYGGSLEYQWQSSTVSDSTGFADISGATGSSYQPEELSLQTWFKRLARVSCKSDWTGAAESNVIVIDVDPVPSAIIDAPDFVCLGDEITLIALYDEVNCSANCELPQGYCSSYATIGNYQYINSFKIDNTQNLSLDATYSDFTDSSFKTLYLDSSYQIALTIAGPMNYANYTMLYLDWNRDGDFDDVGEAVELGGLTGVGTLTGTVSVPSNAVLGQTMLRVVNRKNSYAPACGNYPVGETEDYLITLKTVDPASITTYSWAGPASQQSGNTWTIANSSLTDAGSYSLTVTNTFGCSTSTSHDVVVANPQIDFGQVVTDQEAPFSLQLTPGTFQAYSWSNGSSANELNISEFGTYSLTVSDYSCLDSASITLNEVQYIPLEQGWSMFSTYINQTNNIADVMSAITNSIFLVKNNSGQVYWPAMSINNINNMVVGQGYQAKMSTAETLRIEGISVDPENSPIFLNAGINTIGMLRHYPVSVTDLFYSVIQDLVYVKLNSGLVYLPQYQVNQVVQLTPDDGFKVMMLQSGTITYPANYPDGLQKEEMLILSPVHYPEVLNTGSGMTLVLPNVVVAGLLQYGDEVAVYTANNLLVGSAVYTGETMAMPVWGQDDTQQQKSGLSTTEPFTLEVYNQQTGLITRYEHIEYELGDGRYHENSLAVVKTLNLNWSLSLSKGNLNLNIYPNPATDFVQVNLSLPEAADARIELFNAGGQLLQSTIIQGNKGINQFKLNLKSYSSGNYILRVFTLNSTEEASFLVRN